MATNDLKIKQNKSDLNKGNLATGFIVGGALGALLGNYAFSPKSAYSNNDYDNNGVKDVVVSSENKETILFGVNDNGRVNYFSPDEMKSRNPVSSVDYQGIEDKLNE